MTEETFTRELARHAEQVHGTPLTFGDVRGRARSIRRRRRGATVAAGAVAAAAVVAILVPAGLGGGDDDAGPEPMPSPSPSEVLATSAASSVLHDGVLTRPDGTSVDLDVDMAGVSEVGVLTDGRVVVASSEPYGVRVYDAEGELEREAAVAINAITTSADNHLVAWYDESFRVVVLESGVAEPTTFEWGIPMPGEAVGSIDAVLGRDCANGGCTVLGGDFTTTTSVLTSVTEPAEDLKTSEPLLVRAVSADGKDWAVTFPAGDGEQFGCSSVYTPATDDLAARNCDTTLWTFSPDDRHVIGSRGDNSMWSSVEVFEADAGLEPVLTFTPEDGSTVDSWGWADAEHLFVVVAGLEKDPQWSLLRVPIDGSEPETLAGPLPGPNPEAGSLFVVSE